MSINTSPIATISPESSRLLLANISSKLLELLRAVRGNYVFHDSFNTALTLDSEALGQLGKMHDRFAEQFTAIIRAGMPDAPQAVAELVRQISVKSTAFCSAVAFGEIDDIDSLAKTAVCIALIQWVDHGMDRGDAAMREAVRMLILTVPLESVRDSVVRARYNAIMQIERLLREICDDRNDLDLLAQSAYGHTLFREMLVGDLSHQYQQSESKAAFLQQNSEQIAWLSITNVALIFVAGMLYAVYRRHDPSLPDLQTVMADKDVMHAVQHAANAAIRGWDDLGDYRIDASVEGEWGKFVINLFNQQDATLLKTFLSMAGVPQNELAAALDLFSRFETQERKVVVFFADLVATQFSTIPAQTAEKYAVFLTLVKRVVEAGYVNRLSDINVADGSPEVVQFSR